MRSFMLICVTSLSVGLILKGVSEVHFPPQVEVSYAVEESISLEALLQSEWDCSAIKPVVYKKLPNLSGVHPSIRKKAFIRLVLPAILIAKKRLELHRALLMKLIRKEKAGLPLSDGEKEYIIKMMKKYRVKTPERLLTRLRVPPTSLIIAQAAIESGWGSSRFALEANNLFGIWQFKGEGGLRARESGARLRQYESLLSSIEEYLYNLNIGWAYEDFRKVRLYTDNPIVLIEYLSQYSTLRKEYTERLKDVIIHNRLSRYDKCQLEE